MLLRAELLPLLEKFSKTCILLLRPESVHFILRAVDADGMHMSAECSKARQAPHHRRLCSCMHRYRACVTSRL